jgi:hypothetical protein
MFDPQRFVVRSRAAAVINKPAKRTGPQADGQCGMAATFKLPGIFKFPHCAAPAQVAVPPTRWKIYCHVCGPQLLYDLRNVDAIEFGLLHNIDSSRLHPGRGCRSLVRLRDRVCLLKTVMQQKLMPMRRIIFHKWHMRENASERCTSE